MTTFLFTKQNLLKIPVEFRDRKLAASALPRQADGAVSPGGLEVGEKAGVSQAGVWVS